jgi:hypothetical protein
LLWIILIEFMNFKICTREHLMTALVPLWDRGVAIYFYSNFLRKRIIFKLRVRVFGLTTLHAINIFSNKLNSKNFLFGNALFF